MSNEMEALRTENATLQAKLILTEEEMVRMARMMREMTESYRQLRQAYEAMRNA